MSAYSSNRICLNCSQPFPVGLNYCPRCTTAQPTSMWEITLQSLSPQSESDVARVVSNVLGISVEKARWRIEQTERLLGVGLNQETAWELKTKLRDIGATSSERFTIVRSNPFPGEPADPKQHHRASPPGPLYSPEIIIPTEPKIETRVVVGLSLGSANFSLAFVRAKGDRLLALPSMISLEGQTVIPTAILSKGRTFQVGQSALRNYVISPDDVVVGFTNTPNLAEYKEATISLLTFLHELLTKVIGTKNEVFHVSLGNSLTLEPSTITLLVEWINQTGMQVNQVVPDALAVVAAFQQQEALLPLAAGQAQYLLVIDGGSSSYRVSCVERLDNEEMTVIDNQVLSIGGVSFDRTILAWLQAHLSSQNDSQTSRELAIITRDFKSQMSRSFGRDKQVHTQYCMLTDRTSPQQITIRREEFEQLVGNFVQQLETAIDDAPSRIGLQREDIDYVLLAGGGAGWYFIPEMIRKKLGKAPLKEVCHEETIARGLAVYGLRR